jgi:catechol 2,3-dioxygenase-like lactoylglutathione lyase family enzyme
MAAQTLSGLHHLKIPVADLERSLDWYERVFDAVHVSGLDHFDGDGTRYATILNVPGIPVPLELRWAPIAARALRECDIIVLGIDSAEQIADWAERFDANEVEHSPTLVGAAGPLVVLVDPHGSFIRLMVTPPNGATAHTLPARHQNPEDPWLNPAPMRHPRAHGHERSSKERTQQ